ncbi:MAG: alpha/beta hydrolase [Anaerolineales bacterium]|nr:alpha/beta hydrolase [Anaerolineales bacterium]
MSADTPSSGVSTVTPPAATPSETQPWAATSTLPAEPTSRTHPATETAFDLGEEITIDYLRNLEIAGGEIIFRERLPDGPNYQRHLVSYLSEGHRIYGLLTIPNGDPPEGGYQAVVFNHGYIPPAAYRTTERYEAYVNYLARSGLVVFKIDYRGHGNSQGEPAGAYFSPGYTIDAISALKSLQRLDIIDPQGIGMWGHSMAGNLVLRAMLIEPDVQAGVIWSGAVYSYEDFVKYGISDSSYRPPPTPEDPEATGYRRRSREIFDRYGRPDLGVDYWGAVSLTKNIEFLNAPLQLHHAADDPVVNIGYSLDLVEVLQGRGKDYEFYIYEGGGHNLISPYFDQAMLRTVEFFRDNL